jgi:hypothetical protein
MIESEGESEKRVTLLSMSCGWMEKLCGKTASLTTTKNKKPSITPLNLFNILSFFTKVNELQE